MAFNPVYSILHGWDQATTHARQGCGWDVIGWDVVEYLGGVAGVGGIAGGAGSIASAAKGGFSSLRAATTVAEAGSAAPAGSAGLLSRIRAIDWADETGSIGGGTPRTNTAQNKQFNDAIKDAEWQLGRTLSKDERSAVHREISGQDYGYHDIVDEILGMFGGEK